jgi:DNA helicase-2/ATP-dependent DNA helicase PcrA
MSLLTGLNPAQMKAVENNSQPLMILAGAGSGKTKTLVSKICYLIEKCQLSPYQVLAVTFSNKAAKEMRERVAKVISAPYGALQITTFHAFCAAILRQEANHIGLSKNFTIYDASESKAVAKNVLTRAGVNLKDISPYELLNFIEVIKNNGFFSRDYIFEEFQPDYDDQFYPWYLDYEKELRLANAVDFGGLITGVLELFFRYPEVAARYQEKYKYLLVDEYQDTNRAQFQLILQLSQKHQKVAVVGDEDQSIYSWRGADIRNILYFEKYFPGAEIIKLEQNYRSSKTIIEAATAVIARNKMRKGKTMWTDNPDGQPIAVLECSSDRGEAEFVAQKIVELNKSKVSFCDMAVFYRNNSQSRLIEDSLRKYHVPYRIVGGVKFYERKEIKDILGYLRLLVNPKDSLALTRVINVPPRGVGATSLRKLESEALRVNCSLYDILKMVNEGSNDLEHLKLTKKVRSGLGEFINLINECSILNDRYEKPSILFEKIYHESGYYEFLKSVRDYETAARIENLEEFKSVLVQYENENEMPNLGHFLETITLDTSSEEEKVNLEDGLVSLMTIHGAKGLEFDEVFVVGLEEFLFPSIKSMEAGVAGLEEERRLFYVAMTRAMNHLYLCFAQSRMLFGTLKFNGPSSFLMEIPPEYYHWTKIQSEHDQNKNRTSYNGFDDEDFSQENPFSQDDDGEGVTTSVISSRAKLKSTYPIGSQVVHSLYGEGVVVDSEGNGADEKVLIKFSDGNKKRFMVKFAPLVPLHL